MGKWEMVRIADVFDLQMGKTPRRDNMKYWDNGSNKWISIADIGRVDKYISDTKERITQIAVNETGIRIVPQNTVIMSFKLSLGKTAITLESMYTNEAIMAFLDKEKYEVDTDYIYHLFCCFNWEGSTNKAVMGATLNKATLSNIKIPIPPLDEQKHIAKNLDLSNKIVKGYKEQLVELDKLVQSVFYEMFGDPVTNEKGWEVKTMSEVCDAIVDCPHSTPTFTSQPTGYMCIRTSIIKAGQIMWDKIEYIPKEEYYHRIKRRKPAKGDIVYSREGAILGIAAIIDRDCEVSLGQRSMLLSPNYAICNSLVLCVTMNSPSFLRKAREKVGGSASPHINVFDIKNFPVVVPPLHLQTCFASIATAIEAQKSQVRQALTEAENLFNSLVQEYFE